MAIQRLNCIVGGHVWERQGQRGRPPKVCPTHAGQSVTPKPTDPEAISDSNEESETAPTSTVLSGVALADRLTANLAARGQLISQQRSHVYSGPRY